MLVKRSRAAAIIRRKLILNFHFAPRAQLYKSADALLHIDVDKIVIKNCKDYQCVAFSPSLQVL
jgi:hypothetical protein